MKAVIGIPPSRADSAAVSAERRSCARPNMLLSVDAAVISIVVGFALGVGACNDKYSNYCDRAEENKASAPYEFM